MAKGEPTHFMSLNMDRGLKVRDDASNSLAEPFLFSTIYLAHV